ncbi:DUF262 domain-containing protein [Pseudomonas sp. NPDC087803]|uniref:DUF262 domain-containing protein n=1 Tax=Pseudomonas sp. NPDC087803 TaxID=3364448 RepID=UPI0037F4D05A
MEPPYQRRGRLWSQTDKAYLIDSILNGFDIPKLYMADFTVGEGSSLNKSKLPYAIIDGKQRLEAIFDFFQNKVVLNQDFVYLPNPELKLGGLSYKDLYSNHYDIAEIFEVFPLTIMSVHASTEDPINELFVRLNRNKPLTGAEIRNAMSGPAPAIIRTIRDHEFFIENVAFPFTRGADLNAAAKILQFEFEGKPVDTKKKVLDSFVSSIKLAERRDHLELAARRVNENLTVMSEIFLPKDKLLSSGGLLPVYYWFCRNQIEEHYYLIREFLVHFENERKSIRTSVSENTEKNFSTYVKFDIYNRSTNDLVSHQGRYEILQDLFYVWLEKRILESESASKPSKNQAPGNIPSDMHFQINCMKSGANHEGIEQVTHYGNSIAKWCLTVNSLMTRIDAGKEAYFVIDPDTSQRAYLAVVREENKKPYLKAYSNSAWTNSLEKITICDEDLRVLG